MSTTAVTSYIGIELRRQLRMFVNVFFMIVLPVMMYLIFGGMQDYGTQELWTGRGNVSAMIAVSMAAYGAITATSGTAGAAAVEIQQGWGRQLALTPLRQAQFVLSKTVVGLALAILPVIAVFAAGFITSARMEPWVVAACAGLILVGPALVFSLYGLAIGLFFRSESAVGAASGIIVVLFFLGNAFMPLSGFLLDMSVFTPVWGVMQLALWPLTEGTVTSQDGGFTQYELWQILLNVGVWATVFAVLALLAARRTTSRR